MMGTEEDCGIIPHSIADIFDFVDDVSDSKGVIYMAFIILPLAFL